MDITELKGISNNVVRSSGKVKPIRRRATLDGTDRANKIIKTAGLTVFIVKPA